MLSTVLARQVAVQQVVRQSARTFAATPWGDEAWRHDKNAFKRWTTAAMQNPSGVERRQLYGFLGVAFGDVDADKDGFIGPVEFDRLLEKVAALPRRYGMAPSWEVEYDGSESKRLAARKALFDNLDATNPGGARSKLAMEQFIQWSCDHVFEKIKTVDMSKVDFGHLEEYTQEQFLEYLETAVTDKKSGAYHSLYEFLLSSFLEADECNKGTITLDQFDSLATRAAKVPRHFGLAPMDSDPAARKAIFESMDDTHTGVVTFRKFLDWTVTHAKQKIAERRAGMGYTQPFAASPWGDETWRHDKNAFKLWITSAMEKPSSVERRELYGYLGVAFGDVDTDKDGFISLVEFDRLLEKVAALPRRYGMAPSWEAEYDGSETKRLVARKTFFDKLDAANPGGSRGKLAMEQFIQWSFDHISAKVKTLDMSKVDFAHLEQYTQQQFIAYLETAVSDKNSGAYHSLYEFLLTCFVEADECSKGTISFDQFDSLVTRAAKVPRQFGLAPMDSDLAARKAIFDNMDDTHTGFVTFRKFLDWTVSHAILKIADHKAGKGYKA